MIRVAFPQLRKHQIDGVLELLVVLPHLHRIDELQQGGEVLLLLRGLEVYVPDERRVEQRLRLHPKIVPGLALALGVGDERRHQFKHILLRVDIGEGVVVHGLLEVDGVQNFDAVALVPQQLPDLADEAAFWIGDDETDRVGF